MAWGDRFWEVGAFSFNLSKGVAAENFGLAPRFPNSAENFGLAPRFPNSAGDFEAGTQILGLGWNLQELAQ